MKERAVKEWPTVKLARGGSGHLYLPAPSMRVRGESETYVPQQRVNALVEALEEIGDRMCGDAQCWASKIHAALATTQHQRRLPVSEQAAKEWPETVTIWRRRDNALGFMPEMTPEEKTRYGTENFAFKDYVPQQRVNALVEALEEVQGEIYLWQIGEGPWQGEPTDLIAHLHKVARTALANYKEGEA